MQGCSQSETSAEECQWLALNGSPSMEAGRGVSARRSPSTEHPIVVWYRGHDLRVEDHLALAAAVETGAPVVPVYVWNPLLPWMSKPGKAGRWRLRESLLALDRELVSRYGEDAHLVVRQGSLVECIVSLVRETDASAVYFNRCYDVGALEVDRTLEQRLAVWGVEMISFKSELLVEPWELTQENGGPFCEFHPFMEKWLACPRPAPPTPAPTSLRAVPGARRNIPRTEIQNLELTADLSTEWCAQMERMWPLAGERAALLVLSRFLHERYPKFGRRESRCSLDGTSRLSIHIRFGEISPRQLYAAIMSEIEADEIDEQPAETTTQLRASADASPPLQRTESTRPISGASTLVSSTAAGRAVPMFPLRARVYRPRGSSGSNYYIYDHEDDEDVDEDDSYSDRNSQGRSENGANESDLKPSEMSVDRCHERMRRTIGSAKAFLKNMCLREFAYHLLFHNPHACEEPLLPEFRAFPWRWDDQAMLEIWRSGQTGYPIIDAAIRELRSTGYLHNRIRFMIAGFLTKYLLIPWQHGLRFLYDHVLDGDIACQALGWQWTAGCHTDAFPFACIVNPITYGLREDPQGAYVRHWVPELAALPARYIHRPWRAPAHVLARAGIAPDSCYVQPVIDSRVARARALNSMDLMRRIFVLRQPTRSLWSLIDLQQPQLWLEQATPDADESEIEALNFMEQAPNLTQHASISGMTIVVDELTPAPDGHGEHDLDNMDRSDHGAAGSAHEALHWNRAVQSSGRQPLSDSSRMPQHFTDTSRSFAQDNSIHAERINDYLLWLSGSASPTPGPERSVVARTEPIKEALQSHARRRSADEDTRAISPISTSAPSVTTETCEPPPRRRRGPRNLTRASLLNLAERQQALDQVSQQPNHPFHCFAQFLALNYMITSNAAFGPHTDFVRLRSLKAELAREARPCPALNSASQRAYVRRKSGCLGRTLTVAKMKQFLQSTLGLEVTGQWDRRAHGGVRGPYAYGLVRRTRNK
ncbi:hypothetical protein CCYA_CCYA05G1453 [Cyanidiococcus yangmingshanensis]|nr:hypothetical protein CCYA_CCYA05G1453 [Cyanidiococcus yangmingshanensis]